MRARLYWHLDPPSPHRLKKKQNKNRWNPLTKLSRFAHGMNKAKCALSEDSDQPMHPTSPISVFAVCSVGYLGTPS